MPEDQFHEFALFLKKLGKKPHVITGLTLQVEQLEAYLARRSKALAQVNQQDALDYVAHLEGQEPGSARGMVRGLALYFTFIKQPELAVIFSEVRQQAITKTRKAFVLVEFRGVDQEHLTRLKALGIRTADQMLEAGKTPAQRQQLAERSGVPVEAILELVKLSDLSRISGVKAVRARLYYDAGVDTVEKIAACEPGELLRLTAEFVQKTGFDGIAPLPKEVHSTIETARGLPIILFT